MPVLPWERRVKYTIRIPANDSLERQTAELPTRPVGRPSHKPVIWYKGFLYQAESWNTARRMVAKVEFHCGELFPRVGFIVTNLETGTETCRESRQKWAGFRFSFAHERRKRPSTASGSLSE